MTDIFKEAKRLHDLGFAIQWLRPKSKAPFENNWTTGPRKGWKALAETYRAGMNLSTRLGTPAKLPHGYLAVIDVDVKSVHPHHETEALAAARSLLAGHKVPTVKSGRGNGSRHYYCVTATPFKTFNPFQSQEFVKYHSPTKAISKKDRENLEEAELARGMRWGRAWEVSLYSDGRHVVVAPSLHPDSGEAYRWSRGVQRPEDLPVIDFGRVEAVEKETKERLPTAVLEDFEAVHVDLGWLDISDGMRAAIVSCARVTDRSGFLLKASAALFSAGLSRNEVLSVLTDPAHALSECAYEHAKTRSRAAAANWVYRYTVKKVSDERASVGVFGKVPAEKRRKLTDEEKEAVAAELAEDHYWRHDLRYGPKGKVLPALFNLDLILTNGLEATPFGEDLFASRIEYMADTPWGGKKGEHLQDIDLIKLKRWLSGTELMEPSKDAILEATSLVANRISFHPVRDWLRSLKWDGVARVDTWIADYCQGRAAEPYLSGVSRKFLLAMVKRVFEPGCQWDYVLILEGQQGEKKSSIARAIAGDKWFMDNLPDLKDKDSMLNLQGKWLIELGELANVKRADYNQVKAYLVRRTDTVRPHYGRLQKDVPRQSVFIGTINEGQYLKDPTGNRRYWPVKVGACDVEGLMAVRDQLFAEAMSIYLENKEILMLDPEANEQAKEAQDSRRVDDDESEMREALLEFIHNPVKEFNFKKFKTRDLMTGVDAPWGPWAARPYVTQTGATILSSLGFERRKRNGQRTWKGQKVMEKILGSNLKARLGQRGADLGGLPQKEDFY